MRLPGIARATPILLLGYLVVASSGCTPPEPLGTLRFPEQLDGGAGSSAGAEDGAVSDDFPRFLPELLRPVQFRASYLIQVGNGARRQEELTLSWDRTGGVHRVQAVSFQAPGEPAVERRNEELLQGGVHLTRGGDGHWWRHPDLEDWSARLDQDLRGGAELSQALQVARRAEAAAGPSASGARPVNRFRLEGPSGAEGTLLVDRTTSSVLSVHLEERGSDHTVRYEANLSRIGDPTLHVPVAVAEELREPNRVRTYWRLAEHLRPYLTRPLPLLSDEAPGKKGKQPRPPAASP